jgi:hypothetical protein
MYGIVVPFLFFGLGTIIENSGRPGSLATSHLFYGWSIMRAIFLSAYVSAILTRSYRNMESAADMAAAAEKKAAVGAEWSAGLKFAAGLASLATGGLLGGGGVPSPGGGSEYYGGSVEG